MRDFLVLFVLTVVQGFPSFGQTSKFVLLPPMEVSALVEWGKANGEFIWMDLGLLGYNDVECNGCAQFVVNTPSSSTILTVYDSFAVLNVNSVDGEFEIRLAEQNVTGRNSFNKVYRSFAENWGGQRLTDPNDLTYRTLILSTGW